MGDPNDFRSPPDLSKVRLDFSAFHPLDHRPGRTCAALPGGVRHHLKVAWVYRWSGELRRHTLCRLRVHDPAQVTRLRDRVPHSTWVGCRACGRRLSEPQPF